MSIALPVRHFVDIFPFLAISRFFSALMGGGTIFAVIFMDKPVAMKSRKVMPYSFV
jgi:hypothetical protein